MCEKHAGKCDKCSRDEFCTFTGYAHNLIGFTLDDAVNYMHFHLKRAEAPAELFADNAIKSIFHQAKGIPRRINQIAIHALIRAAIFAKRHH